MISSLGVVWSQRSSRLGVLNPRLPDDDFFADFGLVRFVYDLAVI